MALLITDFGFTGQRDYSYIQLIDFNARFYSLRLGIDQFSTDRLEIALRIVEGRG
ncbi:MAG: hypothetical protein P8Y72_08375 [Anaerolineales bacterium]|jgi:hypothetical protein